MKKNNFYKESYSHPNIIIKSQYQQKYKFASFTLTPRFIGVTSHHTRNKKEPFLTVYQFSEAALILTNNCETSCSRIIFQQAVGISYEVGKVQQVAGLSNISKKGLLHEGLKPLKRFTYSSILVQIHTDESGC